MKGFPQNGHKRPRSKIGVRQVYVTRLLGEQVSVGDVKEEQGESPEGIIGTWAGKQSEDGRVLLRLTGH